MRSLLIICTLLFSLAAQAQQSVNINMEAMVPAINLEISWNKTTLLIFPEAISKATRGEKFVLAEQVKGVENILMVKAGQKGFDPSNLNVVTADGKVYVFNVTYSEQAPSLPVYIGRLSAGKPAIFSGIKLNEQQVRSYAELVSKDKPFINNAAYNRHGMLFRMEGIYIREDVLFVRFNLKNQSLLGYDLSSLRFFVRDKKKAKRTAEQDNELKPAYLHYYGVPEDKSGQTIVAAFQKFTIAEKKYVLAEVMENNGDRSPRLKFGQKLLLKARNTPQ